MVSLQASTLRVLVADDHELTRFSLKLALQNQSNVELVGLAKNGQEAIELARISHPDVIILDLQMPVLDGARASIQIKKIDPSMKIIGYSSVQAPYLASLIKTAKLDAFCDKSTGTADLIDLAWQLSAQ